MSGAGLGLRRDFLPELAHGVPPEISFFEVAPENWMDAGGAQGRAFRALTERHPFLAHGLSLSLGGPAPLDVAFLKRVRKFLDAHGIRGYSEHLSWCADEGHLYDLLPIPFTDEAASYVAARIRKAQDILEREIAIENVSCYATPGAQLTEAEFLIAVLERADCGLLLDVNNVYVNAVNLRCDAQAFLAAVPAARVRYLHVAGHAVEGDDLRIDTHGAPVIDPVWSLLEKAYDRFGAKPTVLERDHDIPPLGELVAELREIRRRAA